jgi:hypothetical protein
MNEGGEERRYGAFAFQREGGKEEDGMMTGRTRNNTERRREVIILHQI